MFAQIFLVALIAATASAGLVTSYGLGGLGLGGLRVLDGGIGLRGLGEEEIGLGRGALIGGVGLIGKERVVDLYAPPRYEFKYGVGDPKTGDRKEQSEVRVDDVVKGEYSLAEPDGTIRVVKYTADDKNGFNAVVSRIGKALHPQVLVARKVIGLGGIGLEGGI